MHLDEWELQLADLQIQLRMARAYLLAGEAAARAGEIQCARELIGALLNEISEHHCKPRGCQFPIQIADRIGAPMLN